MNATLDWGNTRVKLGLFENQSLLRVDHFEVTDPLAAKKVADWLDVVDPKHVIYTQSGEMPQSLRELLTEKKALHFTHQTPVLHSTVYTTRDTLGLDRILLMEAAYHEFKGMNVLAIDMGTCITYDLLDASGVHRGGSISPGLQMRAKAMHQQTARLPEVKPDNVDLLGTSTESALQSGAYHGMRNELLQTIQQYEARYNPLQIIVSGGDAQAFDLQAKKDIFARRNYTLHGLNAIVQHDAQ